MIAPSGTSYFSSSRPLASRIWISPLRDRAICLPSSLVTMLMPTNLTLPSRLHLTSFSSTPRVATPPMWKVRMVSWVPGSPIDWAAMIPTAMPDLDELAGRQVHAVAAPADAQRGLAGHRAADLDLLDLHLLELLGRGQGDHLVFLDHDLVADRVDDVDPADPAADRLDQADLDLLALVDDALGDALRGAAVFHGDHDVLGDVGELAGQVAAVGRLEGRVGQSLAGTVGRAEVLEHREPLAEVGLDRGLDDLARGLGHQARACRPAGGSARRRRGHPTRPSGRSGSSRPRPRGCRSAGLPSSRP